MAGNDANAVALWHFDGADGATSGDGFADDSEGGSAHDLTAQADAQIDTAQSKFGGSALLLDGVNDRVTASDSSDYPEGANNWTLDVWVRLANLSQNAMLFCQRNDQDDDNNFWYWRVNSTGYMRFEAKTAGSTAVDYTTTDNQLSTGQWYHLCLVRKGGDLYFFVDGSLCSTNISDSLGPTESIGYHSHDLSLGGNVGSDGNIYSELDGWMDEARICDNVALDDSEDPLYISSGTYSDGFTPPTEAYSAPAGPTTYTQVRRGRRALRAAWDAVTRGRRTVATGRAAVARGRRQCLQLFTRVSRGRRAVYMHVAARAGGLTRVANAGLTGYLLYRGVDAQPDLDGAAWETFSTLPHTTAALDAAPAGTERTYYFVLRARNAHGLAGRDTRAWTVTVDDAGAVVATPPSAPSEAELAAWTAGAVRLTAEYLYAGDGDDQAGVWAIWITSDGSAPDPSGAPDATSTMLKRDGVAKLTWTSGEYADGTTLKVLVRTRRNDGTEASPTWVYSTNTAALTATAETDGPSAPQGDAFLHEERAQAQSS